MPSGYMLLAGRTGGDGRYTGRCCGLSGMSAKDAQTRIGLIDTDRLLARRFSSMADIFATRSRISMGAPPEQPPAVAGISKGATRGIPVEPLNEWYLNRYRRWLTVVGVGA